MKPHIIIGTMRWGTWGENLSINQTSTLLKSCYDENLIKFDLSDIYGDYTTEALFGQALYTSGINRNNIKISTKCGILYPGSKYSTKSYNSSKKHILNSVDNSLKNLKTDYLDVLFLHGQDLLMNFDEIETTFTELKLNGKVKNFGVNNFSLEAFNMLYKRVPLITNQIQLSLIHPTVLFNDILLQLGNYSKKIQITHPFGNYFSPDLKNEKLKKVLEVISVKYNATIDQILLSWILKIPYKITPIIGSTKIERIKEQIKAFEIELDAEDWYQLLEASQGKEIF